MKIVKLTILFWLVFLLVVSPATAAEPEKPSCGWQLPIISWFWPREVECSESDDFSSLGQRLLTQLTSTTSSLVSLVRNDESSPQPRPTPLPVPPSIQDRATSEPLETERTIVERIVSYVPSTTIKTLLAGSGLSMTDDTITNEDKGSSQSIFKFIKVKDHDTIKASSNDDSITLVAGDGISLSSDAKAKKITITSLATTSGIADGVPLNLPLNGLVVGSTQLVVTGGKVGIGTSTPQTTLDVNGNMRLAENKSLTLTANTPDSGSVGRLLTLKSTSKYDRPWVSSIDYDNRHVATFGIHNTNFVDNDVHKRWELKTVASSTGSSPNELRTRLAIDYDADLANVIFGRVARVGIHNHYGERAMFVHQMRDLANTGSYVMSQWSSELGAADSTVVTLDPRTLNGETAATLRFFRETQTTGQRRFVIYKGDGTATETFFVNAGTGEIGIRGNAGSMLVGDGSNTSGYVNFQSNRTMVGYDGSYAVLQGGISKGIKLNVGQSSFGQGTVLTITPAGDMSVASLNVAGGIIYSDETGLLRSLAGSSGQCLTSNGTSAPSWTSCGTGASLWSVNSGAISPIHATADVLIGGTSTASAKFGFLNVGSGTPTATIAGNLTFNSAGQLQTTNNRTLTFGGDTTGAIILSPNSNTGRVGINTTNPSATLHVSANSGSLAVGDGSNIAGFTNFQANRTMVGYDGSFAVLQGGINKGIKFNVNASSFGQGTVVTITPSGEMGIGVTPTLGPLEMASGAYVSAGGDWTNASDRNLKTNFQDVDVSTILDKIVALPLTQWNYKNETAAVTHLGPVAQDFYSLFGLGNNNTSISTIDTAGVALAGIQGLNKKLEELALTLEKNGQIQEVAVETEQSPENEPVSLLDKLELTGTLTSWGQALFKDNAVFEKFATFISDTVFKGKAIFEKSPEFNRDTAGLAVIKTGADQVEIIFDEKFVTAPQVNATITVVTAEDDATQQQIFDQDVKFVLQQVSTSGFVIKLNQPAPADITFSWSALMVKQPKTFVGSEVKQVEAEDDEQSESEPTPSPTSSNSPSPTTSPVPEPDEASPSAVPGSNAVESSASASL